LTGVHLMSESSFEPSQGAATTPVALTAGAMLRAAREASGLHVAALAVSMKVPVKKLEALEADRLDLLPDAVFVRALASSMCRALRIDATPVLEKLPQTAIPRLDTEERGINAPFHTPGEQGHTTIGDVVGRPSVLLVLVLMVGALVLAFFPENRSTGGSTEVVVAPPAVVPADVSTPLVIPAASVPAEPVSQAKVAPAVVFVVPVASAPVAPAVSALMPVTAMVATSAAAGSASVPVQRGAGAINAGPDIAGTSGGLIGFTVKGASWVEVTDAKGVVQLRKTLAAGESAFASGALPLAVVVGRIDVTEVSVRGKAFSLAGLSKDNVARFEVK
jgi:cytoskeleton protein RodZ